MNLPTEPASGERLMLLDAASLYFRAFFGVPEVLAPDEERFLDRDHLVWMITDEPRVTMDGPTSASVGAA